MRFKVARAKAVRVEAVRDEAIQAKAGWGQAVCAEPVRSPGGLHLRTLPVPVACTPVVCVLVTCVHVTRAFACVLGGGSVGAPANSRLQPVLRPRPTHPRTAKRTADPVRTRACQWPMATPRPTRPHLSPALGRPRPRPPALASSSLAQAIPAHRPCRPHPRPSPSPAFRDHGRRRPRRPSPLDEPAQGPNVPIPVLVPGPRRSQPSRAPHPLSAVSSHSRLPPQPSANGERKRTRVRDRGWCEQEQ